MIIITAAHLKAGKVQLFWHKAKQLRIKRKTKRATQTPK